ncbi:MAG: XRE family transcriptional regulator [Bacteroidota bacterium]
MDKKSLSEIGKSIKRIRSEKGLTLTVLAEHSGVSAGLLSRIENNRTTPSLPVLLNIANALDSTLAEVVENVNQKVGEELFTITRKGEGEIESRYDSKGLEYEHLLNRSLLGINMLISIVHIEPNTYRKPIGNDNVEAVYVLKGEVIYGVEQEIIHLSEGDSMLFDGKIPHSLENRTSETTSLLKVYANRVN